MKKTKLLMPILGISAIATAIVPTISSCNDPKEETKGEKVDVKLEAVIDESRPEKETDIVEVTSNIKEAYTNEDYVLDINWIEYDKQEQKNVNNTIVSYVLIKDADGKTVYTEEDGSDIQYTQTAYGAIKLTIKKERIFEGMQIVISVRRSDTTNYSQEFQISKNLYDVGSDKGAVGLMSNPIETKGTETRFRYQISLNKFCGLVKEAFDIDITSDQELIVYILADDNKTRICPTTQPNEIYLNNALAKSNWVTDKGANEIRISLDAAIGKLIDSSDQEQIITGYFDITSGSAIVNKSQICVYTPRLIQK